MTVLPIKAIEIETGRWVYGIGIIPVDSNLSLLFTLKLESINIKPDSVCKYVGKLDTESNPIYENDIVIAKTPYGNNHKIVIWDSIRCGFFLKASFVAYDNKNQYSLAQKKVKIVGNVLDETNIIPSVMESLLQDNIIILRLNQFFREHGIIIKDNQALQNELIKLPVSIINQLATLGFDNSVKEILKKHFSIKTTG